MRRNRIKTVKSLLAAGVDINTVDLKQALVRMLHKCSKRNVRKEAFSLFKLMSEEQLNLFIGDGKILSPPIELAIEYRLNKLKKSLFESVWATVKTMRQADASLTEPVLILNQILPMLKPEWCSAEIYKTLSAEIFKKTLRTLNELDKKSSKPSKQPKPDSAPVLAPLAAEPVIFRRGDPKLSQHSVAAKDTIIEVSPEENRNRI